MPMFMKKKGVSIMTKLSYLDAIRQAQDLAMEKDQNTFILGEDVGKKGGVFGATSVSYTHL